MMAKPLSRCNGQNNICPVAMHDKKAVLSQGNRAMQQLFFSV